MVQFDVTLEKDINLFHPRKLPHHHNLLRVGTFNVQRIHRSHFIHLIHLAKSFDVLFIQEFYGSNHNILALQQSCPANYHFYSPLPTSTEDINTTGIFINLSKYTVIDTFTITSHIAVSRIHSSDLLVRCNTTHEILLFLNFYMPSSNKQLQAQILLELPPLITELLLEHPSIQILFGGDMNHSMETSHSIEAHSRDATTSLAAAFHLQDLGFFDPRIKLIPTNRGTSCRRIDRIYVPRSWRSRFTQFLIKKPLPIKSTHFLLQANFLIDETSSVTLGHRRFQFPILRLLPHFNPTSYVPFPTTANIDEAMAYLRNEGREYIQIMAHLRKHRQSHWQALIEMSQQQNASDHLPSNGIHFFQHKTSPEIVFHALTHDGVTATTSRSMLELATNYFQDLYATPYREFSSAELQSYLTPIRRKLLVSETITLDRPFTDSELDSALTTCQNGSAPGLDGIQFVVIRGYWSLFRPLLRRTANSILTTGNLPRAFRAVLITLIPKRAALGPTCDVLTLRPILLINCCLRVICKAANSRLQKHADQLIGQFQRGFMNRRRMDQNIMEARTLLELISKHLGQSPLSHPDAALLMADFTKAFDRISHTYLSAVLSKMGIGPNMRRFLMAITSKQVGRIQLNRFIGASFPLGSGVRQGNPVSPLLFNIALEPLLYRLQCGLSGLPVHLDQFQITTIKYHAFADDVNIYLAHRDDYIKTAFELSLYERFSNSKVSSDKSTLYGFLSQFELQREGPLPYPRSPLFDSSRAISSKICYLGIPYAGVDWASYLPKLPFLCQMNAYQLVRLVIRAMGLNVYAFSKLPFRDLHTPLKSIKKLDKAIENLFPGISPAKLYTRPHRGGLGVIQASVQLQGARAKVLYHVLIDSQSWYSTYFRLKLCLHQARLLNREATPEMCSYFRWENFLFSKPTSSCWYHLDRTFTPSECLYLQAWKQVVPLTALHRRPIRMRQPLIPPLLTSLGSPSELLVIELTWLQPSSFASLSRSLHENDPEIIPTRFHQLCPLPISRWREFWEGLYLLELRGSRLYDSLRLFNYGSFVPIHDHLTSTELIICTLCLLFISPDAILSHLYSFCFCTTAWWALLGLSEPMALGSMLAPLPPDPVTYGKLDRFFRLVRREFSRRRRLHARGDLSPYSLAESAAALQVITLWE